jgi:septum formation protein
MDSPIVLASTSPYRRQLLERLRLPFTVQAPGVDEAPLPAERPVGTAIRLALEKARRVAQDRPDAIVIGSDQVAELDGLAIGKPLTQETALQQLVSMQGRRVDFHTALAVVRRSSGQVGTDCVLTGVRFRRLPRIQLERYVRLDQPLDCAGSARIESLGICLIESVSSDDPTALIGLPLIALTSILAGFGVTLPAP